MLAKVIYASRQSILRIFCLCFDIVGYFSFSDFVSFSLSVCVLKTDLMCKTLKAIITNAYTIDRYISIGGPFKRSISCVCSLSQFRNISSTIYYGFHERKFHMFTFENGANLKEVSFEVSYSLAIAFKSIYAYVHLSFIAIELVMCKVAENERYTS